MAKELKVHPAAEIFPPMSAEEYAELKADIGKGGLIDPILLHQGQVIDGRHRYRACRELGVNVVSAAADLNGRTPEEFVWALNGTRRHLTISQRAMIAAAIAERLRPAAEERQKSGLKRGDSPSVSNDTDGGRVRETAAEMIGVAPATVARAQHVAADGSAALVEAVKAGEIAVTDAEKIVDLPKAQQTAAVKQVLSGKASTVAEAAGVKKKPKQGSARASLDELYTTLGRIAPRLDDLEKQHAGGKFARDIRTHLNAAMVVVKEWQRAVRK